MTKRAFLLLMLLSLGLTAWAQESPFRDFDPYTVRTLYFQYVSGSESLGINPDFDGAAVQMVTDGIQTEIVEPSPRHLLKRASLSCCALPERERSLGASPMSSGWCIGSKEKSSGYYNAAT